MRVVIQLVSEASVTIENVIKGKIGRGFMILLGIEAEDTEEDIAWLASKICGLRVFSDAEGLMNESILDQNGEVLLISQFTLHASTKKGNRPSFLKAAKPDVAIPLYEKFIGTLSQKLKKQVKTGVFGADMKVSLVNDGPVTITIDSKNKE
ncbi:D-aminoacyl-tRNA deacylase [Leeuwenhoekiella marinoflava]|uniref:D-aminoacyl-tRNA deacylase n=2 Tax=Leeuwenhoekiella marinoflava TaxID=988 RepID=A0A4Q0PPM7_9FLAO|nr:D-aminoacyl-tRNA deacylase [Leeuwenhoekiella marinoflava]RXG31755.1 D-tyrosyl-tRNA(Tyr) deacylase [Leeuwenhoekiella marinoflava]SHF06190.1 D-tyrosyl-tRNA(Tyr) deacylase [Leeuwenhoekiella marinoflava DSM 3653]